MSNVMGNRLWLTLVSLEPGYGWPWCHGNQAMADLDVMGTRLWQTLMSWEPGYGWPWCQGTQAMADLDVIGTRLGRPWCHGNQAMAHLGVMETRLWLTLVSWEPVHDIVQNYQHCSRRTFPPTPCAILSHCYTSTHSEDDVVNTVHMNTVRMM